MSAVIYEGAKITKRVRQLGGIKNENVNAAIEGGRGIVGKAISLGKETVNRLEDAIVEWLSSK